MYIFDFKNDGAKRHQQIFNLQFRLFRIRDSITMSSFILKNSTQFCVLEAMRKLAGIVMAVIMLGCAIKEQAATTVTDSQIEDNIFFYGSVTVKVNQKLTYYDITKNMAIDTKREANIVTRKEFHIFTRAGTNKLVLIETHTRISPHTFRQSIHNLTHKMAAIQKGKKPIDGNIWEVYIRALPKFPEQIANALRAKGIRFEPYGCGLEIGICRVISRFRRIYVSYIEGSNNCSELPQNGSVLSDQQIQMIRKFSNQFDENITLADAAGEEK